MNKEKFNSFLVSTRYSTIKPDLVSAKSVDLPEQSVFTWNKALVTVIFLFFRWADKSSRALVCVTAGLLPSPNHSQDHSRDAKPAIFPLKSCSCREIGDSFRNKTRWNTEPSLCSGNKIKLASDLSTCLCDLLPEYLIRRWQGSGYG